MNSDIRERWTAALRSGTFPQGRHLLSGPEGYCCLGVLCELAYEDGVVTKESWPVEGAPAIRYGTEAEMNSGNWEVVFLPESVMRWAGIESPAGFNPSFMLDGLRSSLARINDSGKSFSEIADLIEEHM